MPITSETPPKQVAEIVGLLADPRQTVDAIDQSVAQDEFDPTKLVMTSMGNHSKAVITPYYPALQHEPKLIDRFIWSKNYNRPFVEASLSYSKSRLVANVTLRLCVDPQQLDVIEETAWCYPLAVKHGSTKVTEDVVSAIKEQGEWGYGHSHRSGLIVMTPERENSKKRDWVLSHIMEPGTIVEGMVARIPRLPFTEL